MAFNRDRNPVFDFLENRPFPELAHVLRNGIDTIVATWEILVREILPDADKMTFSQLRDQLPETLARLADALESPDPEKAEKLVGETGAHGTDRFHQGYNVEELIIEYRLLRRVVVDQVGADLGRPPTRNESLALSMGVDTLLQEGVVAFVNHQRDELSAANETESKFLAYLSHDLRNRLNQATLLLEVIAAKLKQLPDFAEDVSEIEEAQQSIFETIEGMERLLQSERLRRGVVAIKTEPVDLVDLVEELRNSFMRQAQYKGLKITSDVPAGATCESDRRLLALVLHNLLSNAIKYSERGTVTISVTPAGEDAWTLSVSDEGPGIAPEDQQRLFREFVRGQTEKQPGVGLGLAIASRAANLLGAELKVESNPGVGSVFRLPCPKAAQPGGLSKSEANESQEQPRVESAKTAAFAAEQRPAKSRKRPGRLQILLAEDDATTARVIARFLTAEGYAVRVVGSYKQAMQTAGDWLPDLLICDIGLPDKDGLELMRNMRQAYPSLRGLVVSGYATSEDIAISHDAGFFEHLSKPISLERLSAAIRRTLA